VRNEKETFGMLFYTEVYEFESELHSEIESVHLFDYIPKKMTYPLLQPYMITEVE